MKIELADISKRYGQQCIPTSFAATMLPGLSYAITGPNGSGKSTLLKIIAGLITPSSGTISYTDQGSAISPDEVYCYLSICAPYLNLPEELTLRELVSFHGRMRGFYEIDESDLIANLEINPHKEIRDCSSGMQQRIKLALAYHSIGQILLLDEPTSYMDERWKSWYRQIILTDPQHRTILICSNDPREYDFVTTCYTLDAPI